MSTNELCVVRLPAEDWAKLQAFRTRKAGFRHVVGETLFSRAWRVTLVLVDGLVVGAALVRRFGHPGSVQDGLEFRDLNMFAQPPAWSRLVAAIPTARRIYANRIDGDPLPKITSVEVESALTTVASDAEDALSRLRTLLTPSNPGGVREAVVREQRDAVALGLEMAGLDSRSQLDVVDLDLSVPFLTGFNRSRVSEAAVVRHDSTAFDNWLRITTDAFDTAHFQDPEDPARQVTVFYADKEKLENQVGTDLLYFRYNSPGFVLVQYKRMRIKRATSNRAVYYPDEQLQAELTRAKMLPSADPAARATDWRICEDAFYVKLVREDLAKPPENKLVRGMYLPLTLIGLLLEEADSGTRPKGWSSENLSTYLSNDEFLMLAKQGFIGTRGEATDYVMRILENSLDAAHGAVLAVDYTDPRAAGRLRHG